VPNRPIRPIEKKKIYASNRALRQERSQAMNTLGKYILVGVVIVVLVPVVLYPLTRERLYYTKVERIVTLHSNKWGDETLEFHFQYPHYVESHFLDHPDAASRPGETVPFADGSWFQGSARVDSQSIAIQGTFVQSTGAEWTYNLTRSLNLGGLVGVSGTADMKMPVTFIQEGDGEKVKLNQHHFGSWW